MEGKNPNSSKKFAKGQDEGGYTGLSYPWGRKGQSRGQLSQTVGERLWGRPTRTGHSHCAGTSWCALAWLSQARGFCVEHVRGY